MIWESRLVKASSCRNGGAVEVVDHASNGIVWHKGQRKWIDWGEYFVHAH